MNNKKRKAASRYGTFLGEIDQNKRNKMFETAKNLVAAVQVRNVERKAVEPDRENILSQINRSFEADTVAGSVGGVDASEFALSPQELHWMEHHDKSKWLEYLVYRYRFRVYPGQLKLLPFPIYLLIEPTSVCNLRCGMCFQADASFHTKEFMGMMEWDLFVKLVDEAIEGGCCAITLASRGEPLLHERFGDMLRYLSQAGIMDVKVNTNATRLTESLCHDILSSEVSEVVFSVDASKKEVYEAIRVGADFDAVVANIKRFGEVRQRHYRNSPTSTRITGVLVREDQNLEEMREFWSAYVDEVVMKTSILRWDTYNNEPVKIVNPCSLLWERMYVWFDGTVNPCDIDYKSCLAVGNAKRSSLRNIWNGEEYNRLRERHSAGQRGEITPCNRCSL